MGVTLTAGSKPAKRFKWSKRIAIAVVIYTILGFFVVPPIVKWQMLKRLPALTKRQAVVEQVKFNPYALSLTIRGFSLKEPDSTVFVSFDEFYVNFELWASLFKRSWVFKKISLKKPFAQITYQQDGTFNFANLIDNSAQPPKPEKPPGPLPAVRIYNLCITNGALALADLKHKAPFRTELLPIEVNLTNLTTIRNDNSPYSFYARAGSGETFAWAGTVGVTPPRSAGSFRLGGLKLATYSTYIHDYAKFDIVNGELDVTADYRLAINTNGQDLEVSNALVELSNLKLKDPATREIVVSIPQFSVMGAQASIAKQFAWATLVKTTGGFFLARRSHEGKINLITALNLTPKTTEQISNVVQTVVPWTAGADEISIGNYAVKVEDQMPAKPASLSIDQLSLDLKNVSDKPNARATVALSLRFQESGNISVNGTATFIPLSADMQMALTNIDLRSTTPYVTELVKLLITDGSLNLHGHVRFMGNQPGEPMANFTGDLAVNKFVTTDDVLFKQFLKWDSLTVDGIKLDIRPDKLAADQVKLAGLNTSIVRGPDGQLNLQTILRNQLGTNNASATTGTNKTKATARTAPAATANAKVAAPAAMKNLPDVKLGALVLDNASIHFLDESLEPHCSFDVQAFSGSIKGLSSRNQSNAVVDFKGKVDERSPFSMTGTINPLGTNLFADVTVNFTNTDLTAFTPYTEKYVGRPLQKGKFSMSVHYLVATNALKAENGFYVDQLTLGPKNGSTNATSLPVKLAIALLKDRNGRIQLDVPVTGRIDDPKFKLGPIIWHVVFNLVVKAATSPFSLLGSMFGGGEEMSFVQFEPGSSVIPDTETNKLGILAKSLYERPSLSLEINGSADVTNERVPLGRAKLEEEIKSLWVKDLVDSGKPAIPLEQVKLDPKERNRLLKKLYKEKIGRYKPSVVSTNLSGGLGSAAALLATMPPPPETGHGAALLMRPKTETVAAGKVKNTMTVAGKKPTAPLTREELELADMQDQLVEKIPITMDDLRDLMKARAARVQSYLLNTQKVTADRLFIIAPKAVDKTYKGESRVNLSLD